MIYRVPEAVANSTFANECPYEGRQRLFFGVGGSGRRPFESADPGGQRRGGACESRVGGKRSRKGGYEVLRGWGLRVPKWFKCFQGSPGDVQSTV